ncbi:MAG: hypothetical protein ACRCW9_06580 [Cetobacterium sp.]
MDLKGNKIGLPRLVCVNNIEYDLNKHMETPYDNCEFLNHLNEPHFNSKKIHLNYFKIQNQRPEAGYVLPTDKGFLIFNGIMMYELSNKQKNHIRQYEYIELPKQYVDQNTMKNLNNTLKRNDDIYCFYRLEDNKYWFTLGTKSIFIIDGQIVLEDNELILSCFDTVLDWYDFSLIKIGKKNFNAFSEVKIVQTFQSVDIKEKFLNKTSITLKEQLKYIVVFKKINEKLGGILEIEE